MVTIYDIARKAGVSPATVSKALNGRQDVNDVTRAHVIASATELGYVPNAHARGLKMKKSWLVGVAYSDGGVSMPLDHPLFLPLLDSFKRIMEAEGYELLFFSDTSSLIGNNMVAHCFSRQVDGVLLVKLLDIEQNALRTAAQDIPMVSCNLLIDGIPAVITDNFRAAYQAVEYLYSLGHRRIAHVAGPLDSLAVAGPERLAGYRAALADLHLESDASDFVESKGWAPDDGAEAFLQLLDRKDRLFTAVFFASDAMMMGAMPVMERLGLSCPDDLSLIGFDGAQWTEYVGGGYTTFRQQAELLGVSCARSLLRQLDGDEVEPIVRIPAELVARHSCCQIIV
ncbi:MAG: LacI family DNA-binding transcriptional regulator [Sphaerochaetaceae bacterium]|jgi:DNA-binding LacI/PurR family transcriptional regulator